MGSRPSIERRLDDLAEQVRVLSARVDKLTDRVETFCKKALPRHPAAPSDAPGVSEDGREDALGSIWPQLTAQSFLSSVAVVSFLLGAALILRTVADNDLIDRRLGSYAGLGYAALLIAYGYYGLAKARRLASIYTICGVLLLFSVTWEGHARFDSLSLPVAYGTTALALLFMTFLGLRYGVAGPLCTGIVGATMVGMALEFPEPHFPYLAGLLLLANAAAHKVTRLPRCGWLIWYVLGLTMFFWLLWTMKVRVPLLRHEAPSQYLALSWLLPCLVVFAAGYMAMVLWSVVGAGRSFGHFESAPTTMNVVGAYLVARSVVIPWHGNEGSLGLAGSACSLVLVFLAVALAGKGDKGARAATSLTVGALVLLAISLAAALTNPLLALLLWSLAGLGVAVLAGFWQNRAVRAASYAFQAFVCVKALADGSLSIASSPSVGRVGVATMILIVCGTQYVWCRSRPARLETGPFRVLAVLPLVAGTAFAFGALRLTLFAALGSLDIDVDGGFQAGQSVLINAGALVLSGLGLARRNGEILIVAGVAACVGASKVLGYDLMHTSGIPLVLAVFSCGLTAAVGSLVWRRWQREVVIRVSEA